MAAGEVLAAAVVVAKVMGAGLVGLGGFLLALWKKMGDVEKKVDDVKRNVGDLEQKVDDVKRNVGDVEKKVDKLGKGGFALSGVMISLVTWLVATR